MSDEQIKAYSANWIVKQKKQSYIPGVSGKALYLTLEQALPLLLLGVIKELDGTGK
jgi:hypothetical protein